MSDTSPSQSAGGLPAFDLPAMLCRKARQAGASRRSEQNIPSHTFLSYTINIFFIYGQRELAFSLSSRFVFVTYISMPGSLESSLRNLMTGLGHLIEKVIGEANRAKKSVGTRSGLKPILSLESQFPPAKIREMITFATERICFPQIPNLKDQVALEMSEGTTLLISRYIQQQARAAIGVGFGSLEGVRQGDSSRGYFIRATPYALPFDKDFFDYIGARLATHFQGDIIRTIKEIGRVLAPGGQGFFIDFHPFGLFAKSGTDRIRPVESTIRGIEDYYKICRSAGLRIVDLREAFIDESFRSLFEDNEIGAYRNVKGTPLLVFVFFFKPRTKQT